MQPSYNILFVITLFSVACADQSTISDASLEQEIAALETSEQKKVYLEAILVEDQRVRGGEGSELMLKYGKDSDEYMDYVKAQWKQDEINLHKVETYLDIHGYPSEAEFGHKANTAPWMVIHHAQGYQVRARNFARIHKAYTDGILDYTAMSLYLGRMYDLKNGKTFQIESPYRPEDKINALIKALDLQEYIE